MAPNFKKVMTFGKHRSFQPPVPLQQDDHEDDLESGNFLHETQTLYSNLEVGAPKAGGGNMDEYRS